MLSKKAENIFERNHSKRLEDSIRCWCRSTALVSPSNKDQGKIRPPREKISIKCFRNKRKSNDQCNASMGQPCSAKQMPLEQQNDNWDAHNNFFPKFKFIYTHTPTASTIPIISSSHPASPLPKQASISFQCSVVNKLGMPTSGQIEMNQVGNREGTVLMEKDLAKTVKKQTVSQMSSNPLNDQITPAIPNLVKANTNSSTNCSHRRQKSQLPQKTIPSPLEDTFNKPRQKNFQRGTLFKSVRKSQTINTDVNSDSSSSIVIEDYKSLMSKIHEHNLQEEEFQQI